MDLVVHEVNQLEEVGVTHSNRLIEWLAGPTISEHQLAGVVGVVNPGLTRLLCRLCQEGFAGALRHLRTVHFIEGNDADTGVEVGSSPTHQQLEHLTHIHPTRHTEGIEADVHGSAVGQVGHVLPGKDAADDALVSMAAGHFVADLNLAALGHVDPHHHVGAGGKLITLFAGVDPHINHTAPLGARNPQGVIANVAGFFAKDGAEQFLFRRLIGFTLWGDLAHQDVAAFNESTDPDDAHFVEVAQTFLGNIRDLSCDLLRTKLGLPGLNLVLLDVNRGVEVIGNQTLAHQQRVPKLYPSQGI